MSSYPTQQPPRRLERSTTNRVLGGVCGGVATYLNMDANLVRILTVLISLFTGVPVILYIVALFVLPEERTSSMPPHVNGPQPPAAGYGPGQYGPGQYGPGQYGTGSSYGQPAGEQTPPAASPYAQAPSSSDDALWGTEGPPWEQRQSTATPSTPPPAPAASGPEPEAPATVAPEESPAEAPQAEAPATAAPEEPPAEAPEPEPVPETPQPEPVAEAGEPETAQEETSTWESAPAETDEDTKRF